MSPTSVAADPYGSAPSHPSSGFQDGYAAEQNLAERPLSSADAAFQSKLQNQRNHLYLVGSFEAAPTDGWPFRIESKYGGRPHSCGGQQSTVQRIITRFFSVLTDCQSQRPRPIMGASKQATQLCVGGPNATLLSLCPTTHLLSIVAASTVPTVVASCLPAANLGIEAIDSPVIVYALKKRRASYFAKRPRLYRPTTFFDGLLPEKNGSGKIFRIAREVQPLSAAACRTLKDRPHLGDNFQVMPGELHPGEAILISRVRKSYAFFSLALLRMHSQLWRTNSFPHVATFREEFSVTDAFVATYVRKDQRAGSLIFEASRGVNHERSCQGQAGFDLLSNRIPLKERLFLAGSSQQLHSASLHLPNVDHAIATKSLGAGAAGTLRHELRQCIRESSGQANWCNTLIAMIFNQANNLRSGIQTSKAVREIRSLLDQCNFSIQGAYLYFYSEHHELNLFGSLPAPCQMLAKEFGLSMGVTAAHKNSAMLPLADLDSTELSQSDQFTERTCIDLEPAWGEAVTAVRAEETKVGLYPEQVHEKISVHHLHTFPATEREDGFVSAGIDSFLGEYQKVWGGQIVQLFDGMPQIKQSSFSLGFVWEISGKELASFLVPNDESIIALGRAHGYSYAQIQSLCWAVQTSVTADDSAQLQRTIGSFICSVQPDHASTYKAESPLKRKQSNEHTKLFLGPAFALRFLAEATRKSLPASKLAGGRANKLGLTIDYGFFKDVFRLASQHILQSRAHYARLADKKERFVRRSCQALATLERCRIAKDYARHIGSDEDLREAVDKMREVYAEWAADLHLINESDRGKAFREALRQSSAKGKELTQTIAVLATALCIDKKSQWIESLPGQGAGQLGLPAAFDDEQRLIFGATNQDWEPRRLHPAEKKRRRLPS